MSNVKAKYLKDEDNNIFSPITSAKSVIGLQGKSISDFVGTQSRDNGYCYLSNGLLLHWGRMDSGKFSYDAASLNYTFTINYASNCRYKVFQLGVASFEYPAGQDVVGISYSDNNSIRLFSKVKVSGFYVNYIVIGY